jgi:hypothetical protein
MTTIKYRGYSITASASRVQGADLDGALDALRRHLASLPDRGAAAVAVSAAMVEAGPGDRLELGDDCRPATAAELKAWRQWCAAECAADAVAYAGWASRPTSGGIFYVASAPQP